MTVDGTNFMNCSVQVGTFTDPVMWSFAFVNFYNLSTSTYDIDGATEAFVAFRAFAESVPGIGEAMCQNQVTQPLGDSNNSSGYGMERSFGWDDVVSTLQELGYISLTS